MKSIYTCQQPKTCGTIKKDLYSGFSFGIRNLSTVFVIYLLFLSSASFGQAGDLSQIRNGNGKVQNSILDTCGTCWVNGNAGASNAHYTEGMSIAYRSLITGLTAGTCYEYELGYDTYHSAMAIDYLTHFQRLEPHGPFGHISEVIDPLALVSGSTQYHMTVVSGGFNTFTIPAPAPSGITSGSFNKNGTARDISNQAATSFNALPAGQKLMTIYNGTVTLIRYVSQASIVIGGADAETRIRVRFMALKDSVILAWGGHIASRLDWGYSKDNKGNLTPLSAAGISGSPYHMRQKAFDKVVCNTNPTPTVLTSFSGFGNQDRSLSAAAVVPPPDCPSIPSQTKCLESTSFTFTIPSPQAGATYTWSFGSNTANAAFSGGTNTGTTVTIVPATSGGFTAGSFTLNITASLNGVTQECTGVTTGTVVQVIATAAASPTLIDITSTAHSTTLTADIDGSSSDPNNANYNYEWSIVTSGTKGSLTNATSRIATYTAGVGDAGTTIQFKVIATQKNSPGCADDATVSINVNSVGSCSVSAHDPVCQNSTVTHTGTPNPVPSTATYTWSLQGYGGSGTTTSTITNTYANGGTSIEVNATQSYRIVLSEVYQNTSVNTSCYQDVQVIPTPTLSTVYNAPGCSDKTFTVDVTSPTIGYTYSITQPGDPNNTIDPITPTAGSPTVHFAGLTNGNGYVVTVTSDVANCQVTSDCGTTSTPLVANTSTSIKSYNILLKSPTKVAVFPNPFTDKVRFNLVSGVSGMGTLELYNLLGQKVATVFEGYIKAGTEITKDYNAPRAGRNTLIYLFKVGDQRVTGKLIELK